MRVSKTWAPVPRHQPDAYLNQINPAQNTWYTVLDTTSNCRLIQVEFSVQVTGEQLEVRITTDDVVLLCEIAASPGLFYYLRYKQNTQNGLEAFTDRSGIPYPFLLESSTVKVEIRKTTALGAGNISCLVKHARW